MLSVRDDTDTVSGGGGGHVEGGGSRHVLVQFQFVIEVLLVEPSLHLTSTEKPAVQVYQS